MALSWYNQCEGVFFPVFVQLWIKKKRKTTNGLAHSIGHLNFLGKKRIWLKWFVHHNSCKYWRSAWNWRFSLAFENPLIWFHSLVTIQFDWQCEWEREHSVGFCTHKNLHTHLTHFYSLLPANNAFVFIIMQINKYDSTA